jgi:hypothetical protein
VRQVKVLLAGINDAGRVLSTTGVRARERLPQECRDTLEGTLNNLVLEMEHVEEIAKGRTVVRHVGIVRVRNGVWEIIAAAIRQWR